MAGVSIHETAPEVTDAVRHTRDDALAVLLYGSYARGDQRVGSDVDVLELVPSRPGIRRHGPANIVAYTPGQLEQLCLGGSLFGWHLRTEAVVVREDGSILSELLATHPGPAIEATRFGVRRLGAVLDVGSRDAEAHGERLVRVGRYLLRTALYARSLANGETSFAIDLAAQAAGSMRLLPLLCMPADPSPILLVEVRRAIEGLIGVPIALNRWGSLEALATNSWSEDRQLASLTIQCLRDQPGDIDYAALPVLTL